MSDKNLIEQYTELKAAQDDIRSKRVAAEARLEDAEGKLAEVVAEVKALGFQTVAELQLKITEVETDLRVAMEAAQAKLEAGGYA